MAEESEEKRQESSVDTGAILHTLGIDVTEAELAETRDLNERVHQILIVGLYASVTLMVAGIILDLIFQRSLPTDVVPLPALWQYVVTLRPSAFFSLGLILLILTPLLRVIGSLGVFVHERDWRYAGVTFTVLVVMLISIYVGQG
jgi:uncharacterized membrane protein